MSSVEDTHVCYIASRQTQWQAHIKTPRGQEQRHVNRYTLGRLREQAKKANRCINTAAT